MSSSNLNKQVIVDSVKSPVSAIGSSTIVSGHLVFLAGAIGDHQDGKPVEGAIEDRTTRAFENVRDRLSVLGLGLEDIVSVTIYLSNYAADFAPMNAAYARLFAAGAANPCRTCVGVAALPAGTDIEVTCVAALRS